MVDYNEFIIKVIEYISGDRNTIDNEFKEYIDKNGDIVLFKKQLEKVKNDLENDINFFMESDPAADSIDEIKLSYPGFLAISYYRIAHVIRKMGYKLESRIITELAHSKTGIDIHPGSSIDSPFFIDHGTGIVIGETSIVGKRVKIYQGVTLGALSLSQGSMLKGIKRHPTIGNDVTIYSGASILGNIVVGDDVTIGSNVFLTESIPSNMKVTIGKPILVLKEKIK